MSSRIADKWVFITGATSGIGNATAHELGKMQCNLVINGRRRERLEELKNKLEAEQEISVKIACFDIRDKEECAKEVKDLNVSIDILINNAGLAKGKDAVYDADLDDWDQMVDTNVKGLMTLTRLIAPQMKERETGHILNVSSTSAHETYAGGSVYCATKYAVRAFTEATKKDMHGTKVRVSMVSPGLVETEFSNVRFRGDDEQADEVYEDMQPLTGHDVAEIIRFTLNRPPHVNILDSIVYPVDQSSSSMVNRNG